MPAPTTRPKKRPDHSKPTCSLLCHGMDTPTILRFKHVLKKYDRGARMNRTVEMLLREYADRFEPPPTPQAVPVKQAKR